MTSGEEAMNESLSKSRIAHKAVHELKQYGIVSLYLFVCFGAILFYKGAVLHAVGFDYAQYGIAAVKALILAKFMLVGHALRMDEHHADRPPIYWILYNSFVFLALLVVLDLLEEVVAGALHGNSVTESISRIADGSWLEMLATCIILLLILVPYFAYREVDRLLGRRSLFRMMTGEEAERAARDSAGRRLS
jgi:hypothetical protein